MNYELFNQTVIEYRNTLILIGVLVLLFTIIGVLVIELYVRRSLECQFFEIGKLKFPPTLLMIIPIIFILIFFPTKIQQCNKDIEETAYVEYVGRVKYSESSVKLTDVDLSFFVGKGHEKVPQGTNDGKVIYSKRSKVIVYYEQLENTGDGTQRRGTVRKTD